MDRTENEEYNQQIFTRVDDNMKKSFSLQTLLNLAQHRKDSAAHKLGQLNKQQHHAQTKLDMLQQYRKDYQAQLQASVKGGMAPSELRNFQDFINKLDEAIHQQLHQVTTSKAYTQIGRSEFETTQRKLKSFNTLKDRHIEIQKQSLNQSEQKVLDENVSRSAINTVIQKQ